MRVQNNHFIDRHSYNYENQFTNDLMKEDNILLAPVMNPSTQIEKLRYPDMDKTNLDEKIEEMISVVDGVFTCTICGTTCKQKVNLKKLFLGSKYTMLEYFFVEILNHEVVFTKKPSCKPCFLVFQH